MTDPGMADHTYIEPLTVDRITAVIEKERPDALLPNLGGQTALNLASKLNEEGILKQYNVEVIGVDLEAIARGEDRIIFKETMDKIGVPVAKSEPIYSVEEAEKVAAELGMPDSIVWRHPFPGPGLAIRVLGEIPEERLNILRQADKIVQEELRESGWYRKVWQGFAVLLPLKTVGVMGDGRTYEHVIALRVVDSVDAMTADWARLPADLIARMSGRIINEVKGVNRVVYDVSSKPPSTIEWE